MSPTLAFSSEQEKLIVSRIVDVIGANRLKPKNDAFELKGREFLANVLQTLVYSKKPITMVLPAFPMKSPNVMKKTLGTLPDKGEEIALLKLESIARSIEEFYEFGAEFVIFSDGIVFNDLLGVSDETMESYGEELRQMIKENSLTHIHWDDPRNYLAKENSYTNLADHLKAVRDEIWSKYLPNGYDIDKAIKSKESLLKTYKGFICFLDSDLEGMMTDMSTTARKKALGRIAKEMLTRNEAFSSLVTSKYPDAVRLSIHAHTNEGPKFGLNLFTSAQETQPVTPWHNVIIEYIDGTFEVLQKEDVDTDRFELIEKNGRPWCYKELECLDPAPITVITERRISFY